ncbi:MULTISPECIES: cell division protein ZapE [unclassified Pseudomonas]|uniref:cell division protein ZapE n=1 Tax=unclassified Pseudomonas TaxID=196821 RepID=UPI002AC8AE9F|nr:MULTISPECIES: cell division protein ZapE [unclassified Pseudomonas]MEB0046517.1 cell division protein ZapE [Pseudomonas sp. Dout3]MEB0095283.1 cell division protein ZapE [Pseudomonas sp. DC1.2]WPX60870.1 cell division protein ZapE [Pseudomonas sp. DC1.2]
MAARPPIRSRLTPRWPALRRLLGKAFAPADNGAGHQRVIHDYFHHKALTQGYTLSHSQQRVIESMDQYATALLGTSVKTLPGLYLHGAVGRGKSWLLDGFFQAIPLAQKQRLHFHEFFAQLHQGMFTHRDHPDALASTLDELLQDCRVLCFDEFHVHDIGDAMLITRLFKALFRRGMLLLVTSNYPPQDLLPNPLYHARFKPVIDLINARMQVMEVGGPHDYRGQVRSHTQQVFTQGHYVWPATQAQRQALKLPERSSPLTLPVGTRQLRAQHCEGRTVGFTFSDLCDQPTAVMDYLELCRHFDHWIIDELPSLRECSIAAQQRFINLIDVLYDQDKHVVLLGQCSLRESLEGDAIDLARTRSRLGQLVAFREHV